MALLFYNLGAVSSRAPLILPVLFYSDRISKVSAPDKKG